MIGEIDRMLMQRYARDCNEETSLPAAELEKGFLSRSSPSTFVLLRAAQFSQSGADRDTRSVSDLVKGLMDVNEKESCKVLRQAAEEKAKSMGEVIGRDDVDEKESWHVCSYEASYQGIEKQEDKERLRVSGSELMGVHAFARLWGTLRCVHPSTGSVPIFEGEENMQEATRFRLCKRCVWWPFREEEIKLCLAFVQARLVDVEEGSPVLFAVGQHGSGLSALLATVPTRLAEEARFRCVLLS